LAIGLAVAGGVVVIVIVIVGVICCRRKRRNLESSEIRAPLVVTIV
jgi:Ca2+/Na+ antiporter